jgi:hypothetical protein
VQAPSLIDDNFDCLAANRDEERDAACTNPAPLIGHRARAGVFPLLALREMRLRGGSGCGKARIQSMTQGERHFFSAH